MADPIGGCRLPDRLARRPRRSRPVPRRLRHAGCAGRDLRVAPRGRLHARGAQHRHRRGDDAPPRRHRPDHRAAARRHRSFDRRHDLARHRDRRDAVRRRLVDGRRSGPSPIIAIGFGVGAINGLLISVLRLQPFLVTLATWSILSGAALLILPTDGGQLPDGWMRFGNAIFLGLSTSVWILIVLFLFWLWFREHPPRHRHPRHRLEREVGVPLRRLAAPHQRPRPTACPASSPRSPRSTSPPRPAPARRPSARTTSSPRSPPR